MPGGFGWFLGNRFLVIERSTYRLELGPKSFTQRPLLSSLISEVLGNVLEAFSDK